MDINEYIEDHTEKEPELLSDLRRATHLRMLRPRMMSGNIQGQFLKMLCQMTKAQNILEIGTYTGYAAITMASGLGEGAKLYTIDINDEIEDFTQSYIKRSGLDKTINFYIGDALDIMPKLDVVFDLVFIDADKRHYVEYYNSVFDKVKHNGIIVADDVLWDGKVLDENSKDAQTRGIKNFNDMIKNDDRVEKLILPLRHGLFLIRKK